MSESGSMVNTMNTTHQGHKFTAFGHGTQSKGFDLNHEDNNTRLYCFFSKNKNNNNVSCHAGDKIAIRNSSTIANNEDSTLEKQKKSPKRTTITTIKLFDDDQPPSNISRKSPVQQKSTLTITEKIGAALTKFLLKKTH